MNTGNFLPCLHLLAFFTVCCFPNFSSRRLPPVLSTDFQIFLLYVEELTEGMLFGDVEDDLASISSESSSLEFYSNFRLETLNVVV